MIKCFLKKSLTMPKKSLWDFSTSILSQNSKQIEGGPFGDIFFPKKCPTMPKKTQPF